MNRMRGFTLVEVMIVVALLAIISAIAIPAYNSYIRDSRLSTMRMNLDTLRIAVEAFKLDDPNSSYKPTAGGPSYYFDSTSTTIRGPYGWTPEGDAGAYAYVVGGPTPTTYSLCASRAGASDTWVRCNKTNGAFACTEGEKGSAPTTARSVCP